MKIDGIMFKKAYKQKGLTQKKISELLDINQPQLSDWIKRNSIPDIYIDKIERLLGIQLRDSLIVSEPIEQYEKGNGRIPFYDIDVTAGVLDVFEDESTVHATASIHVPGLDADFAVPVHGNSMQPEISGGDWIAVKRINDLSWWNFGQKYLIVTAEQRLVKIIKRHTDENMISLVSCNRDYDAIDMPKKKVKQLFMVVQVFKREVV